MTAPSSDEQQPWILSVRLDRLAGTATFVRSDQKQAVFEVRSSVDPTSAIVAMTWVPRANAMVFETDRGDNVAAELPTVDDLAPLNGRPVVYLDQNQWSTLANVVHAPERVPVAEAEAAHTLIDMALASKVVLPLSAGHMSETCKWTNRDRRYALALTILKLSRGWQMRDPLELRRSEVRGALLARYRDEHPTRPFDHQRSRHIGHGQRPGIDLDPVELGGAMRRARRGQAMRLGKHAPPVQARKLGDGRAVGGGIEAGLDRLPIMAVERTRERGGEHGLTDTGVGPGDDDAAVHGSVVASGRR